MMQRERRVQAKMRGMERKLEEEKTKRNDGATTTPTTKGTVRKRMMMMMMTIMPPLPLRLFSRRRRQAPSSLEIEMKAIKNVTQTLKNQLKERDERIAKMLEKEKEAKELNEF